MRHALHQEFPKRMQGGWSGGRSAYQMSRAQGGEVKAWHLHISHEREHVEVDLTFSTYLILPRPFKTLRGGRRIYLGLTSIATASGRAGMIAHPCGGLVVRRTLARARPGFVLEWVLQWRRRWRL